MQDLAPLEEWIALIDACIEPLANRPVDIRDPDWMRKRRERPHPLDEAGLRSEAEAALRDVLAHYDEGDEVLRAALRALMKRCPSFCWATTLPFEPTPQAIRQMLLEMAVKDREADPRDMMVALNDLCTQAREAGIAIRPLLLEVAELSSATDEYGFGSTRHILLRAASRRPPGLWRY